MPASAPALPPSASWEPRTVLPSILRGGFVGIHAATDCEYNWQWYGDLVGGYFKSHPKQQEARFFVVDKTNPATQGLPDPWTHFDELYNFKYLNPDIHVLIRIDETSYTGGANGDNHPMSWYHDFDGGRSFYTALGHTDQTWSDTLFLHHLLAGIQYAMGKK
jgi:type 1 glutamine amidotransferase